MSAISKPAEPARAVSLAAKVVGVTGRLGIQPVQSIVSASISVAAKMSNPAVGTAPELVPNLSVLVRLANPEGVELGRPEKWAIPVNHHPRRFHAAAQPRTCA
jgi:hypothetical protein